MYFRIYSNQWSKNDEINYIFKQYILFEILWWLTRFDCQPQFISSINDFQTTEFFYWIFGNFFIIKFFIMKFMWCDYCIFRWLSMQLYQVCFWYTVHDPSSSSLLKHWPPQAILAFFIFSIHQEGWWGI